MLKKIENLDHQQLAEVRPTWHGMECGNIDPPKYPETWGGGAVSQQFNIRSS